MPARPRSAQLTEKGLKNSGPAYNGLSREVASRIFPEATEIAKTRPATICTTVPHRGIHRARRPSPNHTHTVPQMAQMAARDALAEERRHSQRSQQQSEKREGSRTR